MSSYCMIDCQDCEGALEVARGVMQEKEAVLNTAKQAYQVRSPVGP